MPSTAGTSIYRGILTGYNAAFVVDDATRTALVNEDPRSAHLLKPILRGRDIRPYRAQWAGFWLIDTHNGFGDTPPVDVAAFPAIKRHLDKHWEAIARRQDKGVTPYNLRNCSYHAEFEQNKICWMHMSPVPRFSLVEGGTYCNQKGFIMLGQEIKYLCAVLNSAIVSKFVKNVAVTTGMGLMQWDKFVVQEIPVPEPTIQQMETIGELAQQLATPVAEGRQRIIDEIERRVRGLYQLDESERLLLDEHMRRR